MMIRKDKFRCWAVLGFIFPAFFLLNIPASKASTPLNIPIQVTSNPGEDFAPAVSADGKIMVYVSDKSGNLDLWLKRLGPGIQLPDKRLTFHSSEDSSPEISPDGKRVVFVSHRSDPRGDIYILDLSAKKEEGLKPVIQKPGEERDPVWSLNQKAIYFSSRSSSISQPVIEKIELEGAKRTELLKQGGINLSLSPDEKFLAFVTGEGDLKVYNLESTSTQILTQGSFIDAFPRWSVDGKSILFTRYQNDTNQDGQLGIDDNSDIWSVEFVAGHSGRFRQLTESSTYDFLPRPLDEKHFLFTSHHKGNSDIWKLPHSGIMPALDKGAEEFTNENCFPKVASYPCLLILNNLATPEKGTIAKIRYRMAMQYLGLGHNESARSIFNLILEEGDKVFQGLSEIELLRLQDGEKANLNKLEKIVADYAGVTAVEARGLLEMGNQSLILDEPDKALEYFQKVIRQYPTERETSAEAAFSQNGIHALVGNREKLVESLIQVIKDYPDIEYWKQKSMEEILRIYENQPTIEKKVSSLQVLAETDIPLLSAMVQNRIGELYHQSAENLLAKEAYQKTKGVEEEVFKAKFALARIYAEEENFDKSLSIYREISGGVDGSYVQSAREGLIQKTLEKGYWELRVGEVKLALKTFLELIKSSPHVVKAHRGYLQANAALGKSAVRFYQERLRSGSAVDHYALGLALTYLNPPALEEAEAEIGKALAQNSQEVFYHQTLGWIYEQKERVESGFMEKALHEYQIALALNKEDSRNEADLLLNLGNGHYLLNNPLSANHYYREREESGEPFLNPDREAIYRKRYGSAAFKSGAPLLAVTQFKKALEIEEKKNGRVAELHDRIALAYQDHGDYAQAVEHFTKSLELNRQAGNQTSLSKTLRNIANNIYSGNKNDPDSEEMTRALNHYFQSIEKLEQYGVVALKKKSSALIDVNIETGIGDDVSSAAHGFDKTGEMKLIFHYIGKIYGDFGHHEKAIEYFKKKLELIPSGLDVDKNIPVLLEKALLLNQIGNYYFQSSNYDSSLEFFKKSFELSKQLDSHRGMMVNAANISRTVFVLSSQNPLASLKDDIHQTIWILEKAVEKVGGAGILSEPEPLMVLHNYLGILYHFQGFHLDKAAKSLDKNRIEDQFKSSLIGLKLQWESVQKSIRNFELALAVAGQVKPNKLVGAIWQNLEWTRYLAGMKPDNHIASIKDRWQSTYSLAKQSVEVDRLSLLLEAEKELSRLPYGWVDRSVLALVEQLYEDIVSLLFSQKKFSSALMFSEKGKKQVQMALAPPLRFSDEDRQVYLDEIVSFSKLLKTTPEEQVSALLDEYQEFLELVDEDDPTLIDWVSPRVPPLDVLQSFLKPRQLFLKFQRVNNEILVWWVRNDKAGGERIPGSKQLFDLIALSANNENRISSQLVNDLSRLVMTPLMELIGPETESVILVADGKLEFLPWAAMKLGAEPLIKTSALTFASSLSQWERSIKLKNLYNSRLLVLDAEGKENKATDYSTILKLHGDDANLKNFLTNWEHFGVVQIQSPVRLNRLDPLSSFITLNRQTNHFQRIPLSALYEKPFKPNLMVMADVEHEFDPLLSLSSTSLLLDGLVFKGYPGVLLHAGKSDGKLHHEMMKHFMANIRKINPAELLRRIQMGLSKKYPESFEWAEYRFFGFPGMSDEEKKSFAEKHFQANLQKGASAFKGKDWLTVIDHLEKALVLQTYLADKQMAGKIYKTLAQAAYNLEDYSKAIRYQKKILPYSEEDPEELAEAHYFLGILNSRTENFPSAVEHLQKALRIYEEYEILDRLAESYSTLGIVEENALDYDNALKAFNASLAINEEIGEDLNRGRELRRIGRIYYLRLNRFPEARKFFNQAYELFKDLQQVDQQVESLLELGLVAEKEGDFKQALEFYGRGQALAEEAGLRSGLAKAFLYQANSHWFQGNYQQAFRFQRQSLEIARELGDKLQQAFILNTLGLIHWTLNDPSRALENLSQSLELAKASQSLLDIATAYNNIGLVHRKEKRYPEALDFFKKALKRDEQLKSKWGQGYTHRNMGMSYLRMGQLETAETHLKKAVELSREIGNRTNLVKAMLELGNLALERNQWESAVSLFRKTLELATRINVKEVSWRALRGEGFALIQLGKNEPARVAYIKSVAVVDALRAAIKVEEFQNGFLTDKQDVYKELVLLLLNMGKINESFQFAERAKSRSFIDLLGNQKISLKNDVSRNLYETLNRKKQAIRKIEEDMTNARNSGQDEDAKSLAEELVKARNQYQDLLINAKEQNPEISSFVTVEAITLKALQSLLDDSVALIEYMVAENELVAWVISKEKIEVARVPLEEKRLNGLIADYRERIQKLAPIEEQAQQLYSLLIKPVEPFFKGKRILGIIPHGHLHYISFSSLKDEQGYLVEKYPLFYSPSASVMQFTFKEVAKRDRDIKVLAIGNPDLGDFNYDLPLAEMESNAIKWDFPKVDIFTRENATESLLHERIGEYQIIHIASHGEFDPVNPLFSSLKLARTATEDGNFEMNEVFGLEINADIVTLSGCQTGLGDIVGGDELVGLNRAFIYAGTRSILSSLWRVSDISTAVLIKHFYRNYGHINKAESLRKAQLLVKRLYPHPSYWAAFNLTGDYR
ncbi:MAG: tetratricopeptide repeat protein [Nitrospina sp.]|jgi:CHAT domain-containing protein/Tol biopolymer transport system component/Flp pilus assembly protein TadD|nr:tetratricopeptide repeat protein [Nitrospina sp.]MBT3876405.1 tetratricopeptide repeat protein [Nitrospina sp.]MBT4047567.1 tetratricopeptide repeat protein [Nitrospina sp.]MBT4558076.1 tetratricopeptide repeat protein [Nitrospina sp.]MBT5349423.1 tetratricopeptide repeat protein [Nitrospina sp.]